MAMHLAVVARHANCILSAGCLSLALTSCSVRTKRRGTKAPRFVELIGAQESHTCFKPGNCLDTEHGPVLRNQTAPPADLPLESAFWPSRFK